MVTRDAVEAHCRAVIDPCSAATGANLDIVEMGLVKSIDIRDGDVGVELRLTTPACHMVAYLVEEIEHHVGRLDAVGSVDVRTDDGTAWTSDMMSEEASRRRTRLIADREREYRDASDGEGAGV